MSRDLDHLTDEELSERMADCINNLRTRTDNDELGLSPPNLPHGHTWMTLFTEILEECDLRGYSHPGPINISPHRHMLEHAFDKIPDMVTALNDLNLYQSPFLLKYSQEKWLRLALEQGKLRIGSASYYDAEEHNHARRDKELQRFFKMNPRTGTTVDELCSIVSSVSRQSAGWASIDSPTDYRIFSLCQAYASRQFGDFNSDACLVVWEPEEFLRRLMATVQRELTKWQCFLAEVTYYDPVRINPIAINVPTYKPFRHAYQAESRLVCIPPTSLHDLAPMDIEIGPLSDCASLVTLDSHPPRVVND